jgi:hypothetical protein
MNRETVSDNDAPEEGTIMRIFSEQSMTKRKAQDRQAEIAPEGNGLTYS